MVAQDCFAPGDGPRPEGSEVLVKGPGAGRESAVRALQAIGLDLTSIRDVTPFRTTAAARPNNAASDPLNFQLSTINLLMGRYTGPKPKLAADTACRFFGSSKSLERKNYPPGMHGPRGSRRKQSDYAIALGENRSFVTSMDCSESVQFRRYLRERAAQARCGPVKPMLQLAGNKNRQCCVFRSRSGQYPQSHARHSVSHGLCFGEQETGQYRLLQTSKPGTNIIAN
jgi:hypothetical protein